MLAFTAAKAYRGHNNPTPHGFLYGCAAVFCFCQLQQVLQCAWNQAPFALVAAL
jgi:hypothetical protein